jgi:hypothetical protein
MALKEKPTDTRQTEWMPSLQTEEQIAEDLRQAFRKSVKDGNASLLPEPEPES